VVPQSGMAHGPAWRDGTAQRRVARDPAAAGDIRGLARSIVIMSPLPGLEKYFYIPYFPTAFAVGQMMTPASGLWSRPESYVSALGAPSRTPLKRGRQSAEGRRQKADALHSDT